MAVVFILACMFAGFRAMASRTAAVSWLQLKPTGTPSSVPELSASVIEDAQRRLGPDAHRDVDSGIEILRPDGADYLVTVRRATGNEEDDRNVVDVVADALVASRPSGEVKVIARTKSTVGASPMMRYFACVGAGLAASVFLVVAHFLARARSSWSLGHEPNPDGTSR